MTIHQVDPIALRQKLRKLGIGPGLPMSQTFAEDAVRDCLKKFAENVEIHIPDDLEIHGSVTGDVDCVCPKCQHEFTMDEVELEADDIPVPNDLLEGECTVESVSGGMPLHPYSLVLEPSELAYCLFNWAQLWEVPA